MTQLSSAGIICDVKSTQRFIRHAEYGGQVCPTVAFQAIAFTVFEIYL